jgi:hypothetical protein
MLRPRLIKTYTRLGSITGVFGVDQIIVSPSFGRGGGVARSLIDPEAGCIVGYSLGAVTAGGAAVLFTLGTGFATAGVMF